jgi:hypothetical protein
MNEPKVLMNDEVAFAGVRLPKLSFIIRRERNSSGMAKDRLFSPFLFGRDKVSWSAGTKTKVTST